jgi:hypothetical protein
MKLYLSSYRLGTDTSFNRKKFGFEKPTNGHYGVIQLYFFAIVFGRKIDFSKAAYNADSSHPPQ